MLPRELRGFQNLNQLSKYLHNLLKKLNLLGFNVQSTLHLSSDNVLIRQIDLSERTSLGSLDSDIELALSSNLPLDIDQVYFDYQPDNEDKYLVIAAEKRLIDEKIKLAKDSGLKKKCRVDADIFAYERILDLFSTSGREQKGTSVIIDIGDKGSQIFFFENGQYTFHKDRKISGATATELVATVYGVPVEEAEVLKITDNSADFDEKIVQRFLQELAEQIELTIDLYAVNTLETMPITNIYLTGGGANFANAEYHLAHFLALPVNPLSSGLLDICGLSFRDGMSATHQINCPLALGLAV